MTKKNIFLVVVLLILLSAGVISGVFFLRNNSQTQPPPQNNKILSQKELTEQKIIKSKGAGYPRYSLEEGKKENIIIAVYSSDRMEKLLPLEKRRGPGLLVFKIENGEVKRLWESTEEIYLTLPSIEVRDITGDGKNEILAFWSDGKSVNLYIYSWTGSTFLIINPFIESGMISSFNADEGNIEVKDIDGDKIEEVIMIAPKKIGWDKNTAESINEYYRQTYKWDTDKKEYYLWKEEKIGEEKPKEIGL